MLSVQYAWAVSQLATVRFEAIRLAISRAFHAVRFDSQQFQRAALLEHINNNDQGGQLGAPASLGELQLVLEWLDKEQRVVLDGEEVVLV
jgi:hypothetical protein